MNENIENELGRERTEAVMYTTFLIAVFYIIEIYLGSTRMTLIELGMIFTFMVGFIGRFSLFRS